MPRATLLPQSTDSWTRLRCQLKCRTCSENSCPDQLVSESRCVENCELRSTFRASSKGFRISTSYGLDVLLLLQVKEFAQPPHLIFFDENQEVVSTVVVSPLWDRFDLRDLIRESMGS
ncbi:uncharacterized protein KRP23_6817 [Phytophthora ramorum]|uniref:uncharacterized protein n=1 Tax=Phytophthora ramorum TaxID=164328 RepID=UPI00309EA705|nr:hypothetical protein KRP23_6817 [Phytophthora ramorum]